MAKSHPSTTLAEVATGQRHLPYSTLHRETRQPCYSCRGSGDSSSSSSSDGSSSSSNSSSASSSWLSIWSIYGEFPSAQRHHRIETVFNPNNAPLKKLGKLRSIIIPHPKALRPRRRPLHAWGRKTTVPRVSISHRVVAARGTLVVVARRVEAAVGCALTDRNVQRTDEDRTAMT